MSGLCSTLQSLNTNLLSESESELDDVINTKRSLLFDSDFRRRLESTSSDGTDRMFVPRSRDRTRSSSCDGRRLPERPNYFHCRCCGKWKPSEMPNCDDVSEWNHHQHQQHQQHQLIRDQTDTRKPGLNRSRDIQTETVADVSFRQTDRERGKPPPYKSPVSSPSSLRPCHPTPISSPSLSRSSSRYMSSPSSSPSRARCDPFSAQTPSPTQNPAHRLGRAGSLERSEVRESDGDDDWWASPREPDVDSRTSESLHSFDSDSPDRTYVPIELVPSFIPEAFPRRRQCQSLDRVPRPRTEAWSVEKENHKQNPNQRIIITQEHFSHYQTDRSGVQVRDTIRSVSDYERSDNDSPVHHGPPATPLSVHHGPPATSSSVHHGPAATPSSVHHGPPATPSSVHHGPPTTPSSVHHGPPAISSSVHHGPPATSSSVHHGPPATSSVHHGPPATSSSVHHGPPATNSPVHHGPPATSSSVYHGPPATSSPVHHGPPATSSSVHHGPPATSSSVYHGPPAISSSVYHGPPATTSSVHHGPPATTSSVYHGPPATSSVHHGPPATSSSVHHGPPATSSSVHHGPPATSSSVHHGPPATSSSVHHGPPATSSVHALSSKTTPESLRTKGKPPIPPYNAETISQKPDQVRTYQCLEASHSHRNSRLSGRQSKPADLQTNFSRTGSVRQGQPSRHVTHRPPRAPARMLLVNKSPPSATFPPAARPRDSEGNTPSRPPKPSAPPSERGRGRSTSPPTENPPPLPPRGRPPLHPERAGARLSRQDTKSRPQVKTSAALEMPVGKSLKNTDNKDCKSGESLSDQKHHLAVAAEPNLPPKRPPKSWTPGSGPQKTGSSNADMPPPLPPRARRSQSVDSVFSVRGARDQHAGWGVGGSDQRRTASEGDNQKLILEILV